jgi:hypothetical protein
MQRGSKPAEPNPDMPEGSPRHAGVVGSHPKAWNRTKEPAANSRTKLRFNRGAYLTGGVIYIIVPQAGSVGARCGRKAPATVGGRYG